MNLIHFTTVHPRTDTRIRLKQAVSLARALEADVAIFVQDGKGDEGDIGDGIRIVDTGPRPSGRRIARMTQGAWRMYRALRRARPDVAHFHDPELIPFALALKLFGIRIVYDVHEDLPRQILTKPYFSPSILKLLSPILEQIERIAARAFDGVVAATPTIAARFPPARTVLVQNFPLLSEFSGCSGLPYSSRPEKFVYVGGVTSNRGAEVMADAISRTASPDARLEIAGHYTPPSLRKTLVEYAGADRLLTQGLLDRARVAELLGTARAGLVVLQPRQNYLESLPVKMFEYMAAGLPLIASNFPFWRSLLKGTDCVLFVDPEDPKAIAQAMDWILDNPQEAEEMGQSGKRAAEEMYSWLSEAEKLVAFYHEKLGVPLKSDQAKDNA